jgi:hypothetical protein
LCECQSFPKEILIIYAKLYAAEKSLQIYSSTPPIFLLLHCFQLLPPNTCSGLKMFAAIMRKYESSAKHPSSLGKLITIHRRFVHTYTQISQVPFHHTHNPLTGKEGVSEL